MVILIYVGVYLASIVISTLVLGATLFLVEDLKESSFSVGHVGQMCEHCYWCNSAIVNSFLVLLSPSYFRSSLSLTPRMN